MAQHTTPWLGTRAREAGAVGLPATMHGQLYLLANDPKRQRIETAKLWLLGFALRAAVLVDLQVAGHLSDDGGYASTKLLGYIRDPLQQRVFDEVQSGVPRLWAAHIAAGCSDARPVGRARRDPGRAHRRRHHLTGR